VRDTLAWGKRIRLVTVADVFTRGALVIEVDTSLPGERVVRVLERLASERVSPVS
jgi:putative transposase